jgi:hypothetical protein
MDARRSSKEKCRFALAQQRKAETCFGMEEKSLVKAKKSKVQKCYVTARRGKAHTAGQCNGDDTQRKANYAMEWICKALHSSGKAWI